MDLTALDQQLLQAHAEDDKAALVRLYTLAGDERETARDIDAACFYLTHAFVFALESGAPEAPGLNRRLYVHGRVQQLEF